MPRDSGDDVVGGFIPGDGNAPFVPGAIPPSSAPTGDPLQDQIDEQNRLAELQFALSHGLSEAQFLFQQQDADRNFNLALSQIRAEEERQDKIKASVKQIEDSFKTRSPTYRKLQNASFGLNYGKLKDQRTDARRSLKFALARSGLDGGSVDVDKGKSINDRFNDGILDVREYAQGVSAKARQSDQNLKNSLLNTALTGGADGSTLLAGASGSLASIANQAPAVSPTFSTGNYFTGTDAVGPIQQAIQPQLRSGGVRVSSPGQGFGGTVT